MKYYCWLLMFTIKPSLARHLIPMDARVDNTVGHHSSNVDSAVISSIQVQGWEDVPVPGEVVLVGPGHLHVLQGPVPTEHRYLGTSLGFLDYGRLLPFFCRTKELVHDRPDSRVVYSCVHGSIVESSCSIIELPATFHDSRQHSVRLIFQCGVLVFIEPNMAGSLGLEDPEPGDTAPHLCWLPSVLDHLGSSLLALVDKPVCVNNSKPV